MRIIAGTHRSRKLLGPRDATTTRPITDRVKQAMFDRLAAAGRIEGAKVADLFAGTGSMGLECLSRGAERVWFVERDRDAVSRLRQNLEAIRQTDDGVVLAVDALGASVTHALTGRGVPGVSLVFFDPPYAFSEDERRLELCRRQVERLATVVADDAMLIWRTSDHAAPGPIEGWGEPEVNTYGSMLLHRYLRGGAA